MYTQASLTPGVGFFFSECYQVIFEIMISVNANVDLQTEYLQISLGEMLKRVYEGVAASKHRSVCV